MELLGIKTAYQILVREVMPLNILNMLATLKTINRFNTYKNGRNFGFVPFFLCVLSEVELKRAPFT